jgi:predicted HTH transcriptional regulator
MTVTELRERIARGENLHTDFKEQLGSDLDLAKDLVCFANTDGGQLIIGVAKNRTIVGVDDPDRVCAKVDEVAFNWCDPPITVVQEVLQDNGGDIVNAVAHRDYTVRGPVRLFISDDRVEIHTPGKLPNSVTEESMRAGIHVVRNPHIYSRLSDAGLVTRAGTGVRRIIRLVKETTGKDVGIQARDFEVLMTLPRRDPSE